MEWMFGSMEFAIGRWVQACSDHGGVFSIDRIPIETPAILCPCGCGRKRAVHESAVCNTIM